MFEMFDRASTLLAGNDYVVSLIEDEEPVALAASIPGKMASTPLFNATVITMLIIALIVGMVFYFIQCRQMQIRIGALRAEAHVRRGSYNNWSIKSLKEECARLEYLASAKMCSDTM